MSIWRSNLVILICCFALGCAEPTTGIVSGTVTVDGDLPTTGYIGFTATDGLTGPVGTEIVDGAYSLEVPLGETKVDIRIPKVVGQKRLYDTPDSPIQDLTAESLPPRYNDETELVYTVEAGEATKDFDVSTKVKRK